MKFYFWNIFSNKGVQRPKNDLRNALGGNAYL